MSEKLDLTQVILHIEADYASLAKFFAGIRERGDDLPKNWFEMRVMQTVANTFQVIGRDPEGFKAFAASVNRRFGPLPPRTEPVVAELEARLKERGN